MNRPLWKRWAVAVAAFAVFSLGYTAWRGSVHRPEVTLPDGRGVSLLQATFGTQHELEQGSIIARLVAKVAGNARAQRFGYRSIVLRAPSPALIVWTVWPNPPTNTPPRLATIRDEYGMETEPVYPVMDSSAAVSGERIMAWRFDNYPRRAESFEVRFHDRPPPYRPNPLGALLVRNPAPTNPPSTSGSEAPVIALTDPDIMLTQLDVGGTMPAFRRPSHSGLTPWTKAVFKVKENTPRATNWTVRELQLRSSSGNFVRVNPLFVKIARDGLIETGFTSVWWREEPGWILTALFGRIGDFGDTNLWILNPLPADGLKTSLSTNVISPFLAPPGSTLSLTPTSRQSLGNGDRVATTDLALTYKPDNRYRRLELIWVTDQSGNEVGFRNQGDNGHGRFHARLELLPTTSSVQLTFAISDVRTVEFHVKPRFIGTNAADTFTP